MTEHDESPRPPADAEPAVGAASAGEAAEGASHAVADLRLAELQQLLEHLEQVPLEERPALLEAANRALVDALGDLDEA